MTLDTWTIPRRHVLADTATGELFQDDMLTKEEAGQLNERYAIDGASLRWVPFQEREGDAVAA